MVVICPFRATGWGGLRELLFHNRARRLERVQLYAKLPNSIVQQRRRAPPL